MLDEIRILGPLELVDERGPVPLAAPKQRRLLAALVAGGGATRSADALVDALWDDAPPPSAPKLVQIYVSRLRKTLPPCARLLTRPSGYVLELEDGTLDAARFERLLEEGREAARAGSPALAASLLGRALALWRGRAYGELADEAFLRTDAERLEELRLVALEERLAAELHLGRHAQLLGDLRSLADSHPLRERVQAQLMLALYRAGRQSEALDRYTHTRRLLSDELGLEPGAELRELQRRILQHDPMLAVPNGIEPATGARLPSPPNALRGREREVAELEELLRREDVRLVVLAGAGGSGKTRLALEVARRCARLFADGAALVELAPVHDPDLVPAAISNALGSEQVGSQPLETVVAALRGRELLLVVDNFEHLREAAPVLVELVRRAPRLTLLVTSRVVLHLSGEHVYPVEPLDEEASVELFLERAREADARFDADEGTAAVIRRICARLDGLPLALELAAGRVRMLTPAELLAGLERRLPLLTGGPRDLPARQRTLRATLDWSFDLLDEPERRDLARLSVFPGALTLESAEAVCETTLERLSTLVDHHLLVRTVTPHGSRYVLLETVREVAAEQLAAAGEADAVHRRHVERMLAIAQAAHLSEDDDRPFHWPTGLAEPDDLRAALDWAAEWDPLLGLELACAYENFWGPHAPTEGVRRVSELLARVGHAPPLLRARALRNIAGAAHQERDYDLAQARYEESLQAFAELGEARGTASVRMRLAYIAYSRGDYDRSRALLDESLEQARGRFPMLEVQGASLRTQLLLAEDRLEEAEVASARNEALADAFGWKWYVCVAHTTGLWVALARGDLDEAERQGRAALAISIDEKHAVTTVVPILAGLARVAVARGDLERAGLVWGHVAAQGEHLLGTQALRWAGELRTLAAPAFLAARDRGLELDLWTAVAVALGT